MAEVEQKLQPRGQPTPGISVALSRPAWLAERHAQDARAEPRSGPADAGSADSHPRPETAASTARRLLGQRGPRQPIASRSGTLAMCPPTTIVAGGWCLRISRHIRRTFNRFGMIELIPMTSYFCDRTSSMNRSSDGKVQQRARGLQVDLNQHQAPRPMEGRNEKGPWTRVTWL